MKNTKLLHFFYNLLFWMVLPFILIRLVWRSRKNSAYRKNWNERFGFAPKLSKSIWLHSASVGETIAAIPLIKKLLTTYPNINIIITTMTITGAARVEAAFADKVKHAYIPYDISNFTNRFIRRINPCIAIIMETELWPNLFFSCNKFKVPVLIANARLSEKSFANYAKIKSGTKLILNSITKMLVQTQVEAARFVELGLAANKISVTGNIKFDIEIPEDLKPKTLKLREELYAKPQIWLAASTHAGEEEIILRAHKKLLASYPNLLLIIAPRHPERFNSVYELILKNNLSAARRSHNETCASATQVYLSDTMGELLLMYSVADVAFIGGSLVPVGGHNMLEAAVLGVPVITGPNLFNFIEISQGLVNAGGMNIIFNDEELVNKVNILLEDSNKREQMSEIAKQFVAKNKGSLKQHLGAIRDLINKSALHPEV